MAFDSIMELYLIVELAFYESLEYQLLGVFVNIFLYLINSNERLDEIRY